MRRRRGRHYRPILEALRTMTDQGAWSDLVEATSDRMDRLGLGTTDVNIETGVSAIRLWVKEGVREIDRVVRVPECLNSRLHLWDDGGGSIQAGRSIPRRAGRNKGEIGEREIGRKETKEKEMRKVRDLAEWPC